MHVPFCAHKCGYCDFNSWAEQSLEPQERWLSALEKQVSLWSHLWGSRASIETIFWGGGTPSLLHDSILERAIPLIRKNFVLSDTTEWTLECNPETLTPQKLDLLSSLGVNRLSLGIQSFEDIYLDRLERRARRHDNLRALELVASRWKGRWSLDLMFGLPEQSPERWEKELSQALEFAPAHVSAYQLTLTTARSRNWKQPDAELLLEMFDIAEQRLAEAGLKKYEVSNFARESEESRHNLKYWRLEPFLGLGPGASGLLSGSHLGGGSVEPGWGRFGAHQKQPDAFEKWVDGAGRQDFEMRSWLSPRSGREHLEEMLMMGLRLREGLKRERWGSQRAEIERLFSKEQTIGNIEITENWVRATPAGERLLDSVLQRLFTEIDKIPPSILDSEGFDPKF